LGTFSVGFLARPLGGILFGIAGDKVGRKRMLVLSVLLMGFGTFAIGLLPTYVSIGVYAPLGLVILRFLQGIAVGGEATGAIIIIAESMPRENRAWWTSFTMFAGPLANVLTSLVIWSLQGWWGSAAFVATTWRYAFFLSAILVVLGFWTRRKIEESPVFLDFAEKSGRVERAPFKEAIQHSYKKMFQAFFIKTSENTFLYTFSTFLIFLATSHLGFSRQDTLIALMVGSALEVVVVLISAHISDRIGRRPVLAVGFIASSIASFALFTLTPGASFGALQAAVIICLACHGVILGAMAAYMAEIFPARTRYTAMSTSYQLASVAGGSVAPIVAALLLQMTGSAVVVAAYATVVAVPALMSAYLSRETRGNDLLDTTLTRHSEASGSRMPASLVMR
jgi:MFS family permease